MDAGSAIGFPECGSEAWKNREIERMLDNDRYDRDQAAIAAVKAMTPAQLENLIATAPPALPEDMAALGKLGNPFPRGPNSFTADGWKLMSPETQRALGEMVKHVLSLPNIEVSQ